LSVKIQLLQKNSDLFRHLNITEYGLILWC
jgi:hypothetical protein